MPQAFSTLPDEIESWLHQFAQAVRERDFERGKTLFSPQVVAFGTVAHRANSLDELFEQQWSHIWPNTSGFDFDYASALAVSSGEQTSVVAQWQSQGYDATGQSVVRRGRVTLVLIKVNGHWQAIHTHFSLQPTPPSP